MNWAVTAFWIPKEASGLAVRLNTSSVVSGVASCGSALTPLGSPISSIFAFPSNGTFCSSLSFICDVAPWEIEDRTKEPPRGASDSSTSKMPELNQVAPFPKSAEATTQRLHFLSGASGLTLRLMVASVASGAILTKPEVAIPGGAYNRVTSTCPLNSPVRSSLTLSGNWLPRMAGAEGAGTSILAGIGEVTAIGRSYCLIV